MAGRLLKLLDRRPGLIASLPANSLDLARAAQDGGAHCLKVHINVHHDASGTHFGTLAEERPALEAILALGLPTGLVVGADTVCSQDELPVIEQMGFDFIDAYAHHMPAWLFAASKVPRMVAVGSDYTLDEISAVAGIGAELLEAAIVDHNGYGQPLNTRDLLRYGAIAAGVEVPIVVPTQRAITPPEAALLVSTVGVAAVMIGAIVTGKEPAGFAQATAAFRAALDEAR